MPNVSLIDVISSISDAEIIDTQLVASAIVADAEVPPIPRQKPMLPPNAEKKMQSWIRSRHVICSGNFFILETVEYSTIDRFTECVESLGGTLISVEPIKKVWIGNHRQVILYRVNASLHTPHHQLKQYWIKYGGFYTRFDERG
jgi:phycoerythrin-associated linker protein